MNPIFGALAAGYTTKEIINFISQLFPGFSGKISQAISAGHSPEEIIKYLQNLRKDDFKKISNRGDKNTNYRLPDEDDRPKTSMQKANEIWYGNKEEFIPEQQQSSILPSLGKAALGATALGTAAFGGPVVKNALARALPSLSPILQQQQQAQQMPQQPTESPLPVPQNLANSQQSPISNNVPSVTQPTQPIQAKGIINPKEYLDKLGITDKVDELLKRGNTPESVAAVLGMKKGTGRLKADIDPELMENIEAYAKSKPQKAQSVITPHGAGDVVEIRNGKAMVDIDGKKHVVDEGDIEQEPEDAIQAVQDILKIPEVDRSSIVSLFVYDPADKNMYIQFHNGETYKYVDVDPEKVHKIANKMGIPVTEGKNIFGAWSPEDKKSLGATLIKEIIADPKYKKPGKGEAENPNYVKLDTLYDYWQGLRKKPKRKRL